MVKNQKTGYKKTNPDFFKSFIGTIICFHEEGYNHQAVRLFFYKLIWHGID